MSGLDALFTDLAGSLIKEYGTPATLSHTTPGAYDPATGGVPSTVTTTSCNAVLDAASLKTLGFKFGEALIQGGDIQASVSGALPVPGDTLTVPAGIFTVIDVRPVYSGSVVVMSECLVRQ